jgi:hypothetical protein
MRKLILAVMLFGTSAAAIGQTVPPQVSPPCERVLHLRLSQTSYTLNVWKHIRNYMNAVEFDMPVSCPFYDTVRVNDDLLRDRFRWGSLAVHGSFGTWNLVVQGK